MTDNVLLDLQTEPDFSAVRPENIAPAVMQAMEEGRAAVEAVKKHEIPTWNNTVEPLTDITERVGRIWGVVGHLNSVADTPELRETYNALMPEVTAFFTEISQDIGLYERFKAIKAGTEFSRLSAAQQTKLKHDLRDFVLSGAELPEDKQQELAALENESAVLAAQFSQNVLDATDAFSLHFEDAAALAGIPEDNLALFAAAAAEAGKTGYLVTLQMPHYLAVMQHADDRALREKLYRAHTTRASDQGDAQWDNTENINRRLQISQREAQLLGFNNYAELSLAVKMADTPDQVEGFLKDLAARAKPYAEEELAELTAFAAAEPGLNDLQPWDVPYASEKLRVKKYDFSENEVKDYFPAGKVLHGLFAQIRVLYGVNFIEKKVSVWHEDVRYFELEQGGAVIGGVYMDLYARRGKRGGAWMNDYCGRRRFVAGPRAGQLQLPVAYLVCNFTPAAAGEEARLSHDEILTLFHETGHGLHHLLTRQEELGVSGINGVEWDAVEMPSQFMENFVWEYDVLKGMSSRRGSGEVLPEALYAKMLAAKHFQRGLFMVRQMEFALFDIRIYSRPGCDWQTVLQDVRRETAVMPVPAFNRFAHAFGHIFAGGYAAGYYSYSWAEVLSADIYAAFAEEQNPVQTGTRFLNEILAAGGSRPAMESFAAFRGRKPDIAPLLQQNGWQKEAEVCGDAPF